MAHRRFTHLFRRRAPAARVVATLVTCALPRLLHAQAPSAPAPDASTLGGYRTPAIALVQPGNGGTLPQDKPVAVFRFAQGEPADAVDVRSLVVTLDGADVTARFQVVGNDAWGSLADPAAGPLNPGPHQVLARICSARGACGSASAVVSIIAAMQPANAVPPIASKRGRIVDFVVRASKLLLP